MSLHFELSGRWPFIARRRANIPSDVRARFERVGHVALELSLGAGQYSQPWSPEVTAILRDERNHKYLLAWLKEQR